MADVTIKINGINVTAPEGVTILDAAHKANIFIPTLCFLRGINNDADCRMCVVEVKGARALLASCAYPISNGMEIWTNTPKVNHARKRTLEMILSNHDRHCLSCIRNSDCELQEMARTLGVEDEGFYEGEMTQYELDCSSIHMIRDNNKCILCRRCVGACTNEQSIGVLGPNARGFKAHIGSPFDMPLSETSCVHCGQCIVACPTGALYEKDNTAVVEAALVDESKYVVVQTAPSVRATIGEEFGFPIGTDTEGKMVAACRRIGFDKVFDTDFAADLTILEEANELVERITNNGILPMFTSCSPGWVKFCEEYFPDMREHLSTCKSPQNMFGAITKSYLAKKLGKDPKDIFCVSVMPCTAKKFEISREELETNGVPDVDCSITTRELARMIRFHGIDFENLPDENFDDPLGESTGAGVIFGVTGGVMEAALRTAVETLTGKPVRHVDYTDVRGMVGVKEASYNVNGMEMKVAAVSGLANARKVLNDIKEGKREYHFIEFMCCPGGCINGGGQPHVKAQVRNFHNVKQLRAQALYANDAAKTIRKSHENPSIIKLYNEYLERPGSAKAHSLLHTHYVKRSVY